MPKFQPEFENLEPRQLLAGDLGAAHAAAPLYGDEFHFIAARSAEDICFEGQLWRDGDDEFAAPVEFAADLAERLLVDENAWDVDAQIQTDEEFVFAVTDFCVAAAGGIRWPVHG